MNMETLVQRYLEQENIFNVEGQRGIRNLARLVNALGYRDFNNYGQQQGGYCIGDILEFLGDNGGAIEALVEWIKDREVAEWKENLSLRLADGPSVDSDQEDLVSNHYKDCPDCGHEIPPGMLRGEECENCGHVFNWGPSDDGSDDNEWGEMEPLFPNGVPGKL